MRQLVSPREVSDWVLSTQHSHHLDARVSACTHAHKLVLQGQRQPCCSPLQAYLQAQIRWQAGPRRLQAGVERPHCPLPPQAGSGRGREPQTEGAAGWLRSLAVCCFPRPSPARTTVGGRTPESKRAPSAACLPTARRSSPGRRARLFVPYRCHFAKGRSEGSVADSLASCCLSTEPLSTCQEPAALQSHLTVES